MVKYQRQSDLGRQLKGLIRSYEKHRHMKNELMHISGVGDTKTCARMSPPDVRADS